MRKLILFLFVVLFMISLAGCGGNSDNQEKDGATETENVSEYIEVKTLYISSDDGIVRIVTDKITGVQYIAYKNGYGATITPRYNADGSLYTEQENKQ